MDTLEKLEPAANEGARREIAGDVEGLGVRCEVGNDRGTAKETVSNGGTANANKPVTPKETAGGVTIAGREATAQPPDPKAPQSEAVAVDEGRTIVSVEAGAERVAREDRETRAAAENFAADLERRERLPASTLADLLRSLSRDTALDDGVSVKTADELMATLSEQQLSRAARRVGNGLFPLTAYGTFRTWPTWKVIEKT